MARHKKNKSIQIETNNKSNDEVNMKMGATMELDVKEAVDEIASVIEEPSNYPSENDLELLEQELDKKRIELEETKRQIEEKKQELKYVANRDIDADERMLIDKQKATSKKGIAAKAIIEKQKEIDNQLVTGRFMNRRAPGQPVKLPYFKYDDDPPAKWHEFEDGKVYTIKRGFADQINGGSDAHPCYYSPIFIQKNEPMDPNKPESQLQSVDTSNRKYAFVAVGL